MSKAALVSFIIDLKLDRNGAVKILEFGDLYLSGYSGYERLTGKSPLTEKVFPFYDTLGLPVFQDGQIRDRGYRHPRSLEERLGILPVMPQPNFRPEALGSHAAILLHSAFAGEKTRRALKAPPYDQVIATNVNALINGCFEDKAFLAAFGQRFSPDLFPKQKIYPVNAKGRIDVRRVLEDFRGADIVVLKNTWEAQADGVDLVRLSALNMAFNLNAGNLYLRRLKKPDLTRDDVCVVQEYVPGTLITARNENGREGSYDPTMRVILTAWHDEGQTHIKCHDAYYKIPSVPADEKVKRKNTISRVHDDNGPKSDFVPDDQKASVFSQLEGRLPALMHGLFTTPSHEFAREFMDGDDEALSRIGFAIAANDRYFDRPDGQQEYPGDLADKIFAMRDQSKQIRDMIEFDRKGPEGLSEALAERAKQCGYHVEPRFYSYKFPAACGLVLAACFGMLAWPDKDANLQEAEGIFGEDFKGAFIHGLPNLRIKEFSHSVGLEEAIQGKARAAGYGVCESGRWPNEAQRLFPAFVLAMQNPAGQYVKLNFHKAERVERNGEVLSEEIVTDTVIYGTACPKPDPKF